MRHSLSLLSIILVSVNSSLVPHEYSKQREILVSGSSNMRFDKEMRKHVSMEEIELNDHLLTIKRDEQANMKTFVGSLPFSQVKER